MTTSFLQQIQVAYGLVWPDHGRLRRRDRGESGSKKKEQRTEVIQALES